MLRALPAVLTGESYTKISPGFQTKKLSALGEVTVPLATILKAPAPNPKTKKDAARRKSFCARSRGWTGERGKAARRRWNC